MQKKIAYFYPFSIRRSGWGKVFFILVWSFQYQQAASQSISHAYKNQLDINDRLFDGGVNILMNSKKNKNYLKIVILGDSGFGKTTVL